jgi:hypothetical protein
MVVTAQPPTPNSFVNGVDFYAQVVKGGFKLYFMKVDIKTYVDVVLGGNLRSCYRCGTVQGLI